MAGPLPPLRAQLRHRHRRRRRDPLRRDPVRLHSLPGERWAGHLEVNDAQERTGAIIAFARAASARLHAVGAAVAFDTFGQTTVISDEDGIGQVLEDLAPYLDYYSPMLYPSTWVPGSFGFDYPPSEPYRVVLWSVRRAVDGWARLRPSWCDRGCRISTTIRSRSCRTAGPRCKRRSRAQPTEAARASCSGSPSLHYQTNLLTILGQNS